MTKVVLFYTKEVGAVEKRRVAGKERSGHVLEAQLWTLGERAQIRLKRPVWHAVERVPEAGPFQPATLRFC